MSMLYDLACRFSFLERRMVLPHTCAMKLEYLRDRPLFDRDSFLALSHYICTVRLQRQ